MKLYAIMATAVLLFNACTDTKKQEKDALEQVIKIHDEAMAKSEQAINDKMLLDSISKADNIIEQPEIKSVVSNLTTADKAMEDWMHQFNADNTGKSHDQIMQYLNDQQKQVSKVNQQLQTALSQSKQFISTHKK
jgi:GTPase involved in cell partitioning and DNA repair